MDYILVIDCGSTGVRAVLFDMKSDIKYHQYEKITLLQPQEGFLEYNPVEIWTSTNNVVEQVLGNINDSDKIIGLGLTTQRAIIALWEKETGKPVTNFISWADNRAINISELMNKNEEGLKILSTTGILIQFHPVLTIIRLKWMLDNIQGLQERCEKGELYCGTLDTWLIFKLTGNTVHATDYTNASTGLLDPYQLSWNNPLLELFNIPRNILPKLLNTVDEYGRTHSSLFNARNIPIIAVAGDQQAALFGHCCFEPGDMKITLGSGAFVDMNIGNKGAVSPTGLFTALSWVINNKPNYLMEGFVATAGMFIDWFNAIFNIKKNPEELNNLAEQISDTSGVIVIPTLAGIQFPYFSPGLNASLIGMSFKTGQAHIARAVFEGIAMRVIDVIEGIQEISSIPIRTVNTDGGVSASRLVNQFIADYADIEVNQADESEMTAIGAAYLTGIGLGIWDKKKLIEMHDLRKSTTFKPNIDLKKRNEKRNHWKKLIKSLL